MVSSFLAISVLVDSDICRPIVEATLAPKVITEWGALVVRSMLDHVPRLGPQHPELARHIFEAPWSFEETREGALGFGGALGSMVMSWRSVLDTCRTHSAQVFRRFLQTAPIPAVETLLDLLAAHIDPDAHPGLFVSAELAPHDDPLTNMQKETGAWLGSVAGSPEQYEPVLEVLNAGETMSAPLWQSVISAGALQPATLGRWLLAHLKLEAFNPGALALGPFVAAMSGELHGSDHVALEQLILDLVAAVSENQAWAATLGNSLARHLDPARVQLPQVRALLPQSEDSQASLPPDSSFGWASGGGALPWNEPVTPLPADVEELLADTMTARQQGASEEMKSAAIARVRSGFAAVFGNHSTENVVVSVLAEPARLLAASETSAVPTSELGRAVLRALIAALAASW